MENRLYERYQSCFCGAKVQDIQASFSKLRALYGRPKRFYHNLSHVSAMLDFLDAHCKQRVQALDLATFFHDAIYVTTSRKNEAKSALLAQRHLKALAVDEAVVQAVSDLILSTAKHQPLNDDDCNGLFLDADLAILGAKAETYHEYAAAIRNEYGWVPEVVYRRTRKGILMAFLARERLYFSDGAYQNLEAQARANLNWEIGQLSG